MPEVIVVGAGVSGLTCAWHLQRSGVDVLVLESGSRPGGVISTDAIEGCLVEAGPNTILPTVETVGMIRDLGLADALVSAPARAPRFIYCGGRLHKAPWVLSLSGILRAAVEPFVSRRRGKGEESVRDFFVRRFGREVHDRLAASFVGGIYAGDTAQLGIEACFPRLAELERGYRSVLLGALLSRRNSGRLPLSSFRKGMGMLPEALARRLAVRCGVEDLVVEPGRVVLGRESLGFRALVVAAPAYAAARLLRGWHARLSDLLDSVYYAPLVVAAALVDRSLLGKRLEGFGFLAPRGQGIRILGSLFNSALFADRSPAGTDLVTSFLGGALDPEILDCSDEEIWEVVRRELESVLGLGGPPEPVRLFRYGRGIPQYPVGHSEWRSRIQECLVEEPGLFLTGNYLDGVSVPASMSHGKRTADAVLDHVRRMG